MCFNIMHFSCGNEKQMGSFDCFRSFELEHLLLRDLIKSFNAKSELSEV